jgi:hypothetical protein
LGRGEVVEGDGKPISAKALYASEVLTVVQATKELLARILDVDVSGVEEILNELRGVGLPLLSTKAEDDRLYYWIDKPAET